MHKFMLLRETEVNQTWKEELLKNPAYSTKHLKETRHLPAGGYDVKQGWV